MEQDDEASVSRVNFNKPPYASYFEKEEISYTKVFCTLLSFLKETHSKKLTLFVTISEIVLFKYLILDYLCATGGSALLL